MFIRYPGGSGIMIFTAAIKWSWITGDRRPTVIVTGTVGITTTTGTTAVLHSTVTAKGEEDLSWIPVPCNEELKYVTMEHTGEAVTATGKVVM